MALSKTTTLTSLSVSSAVTISFNCGMLSGPKMLSGGWLSVTRQYWAERRVSSIRFVLVAVPIAFFICPPPISEPLDSNRRAKGKQLDEGIGNTFVSRDKTNHFSEQM